MNSDPITLLVCALGGEGGGVLSEWLYELAVRCGHSAQATSIPGVAQRTGATTYYIEICPLADAELSGRRPVFSLNPVPGAIDLLVSSELLETARQVGLGLPSAERTTVLTSSARALTVAERMPLGDGRLDADALQASVRQHSRRCEVIDMAALAREAGTVISAVLFGAIAGSGVLPFPREAGEATIRAGGSGVEASLRGYALGFEAVQRDRPAPAGATPRELPALETLLELGRERLTDYQDAAYAELFAERVARLQSAEQGGDRDTLLTREAARWLVLWMAFDDIVRVAALKLRASRLERVRREVGAREDELVRVYDHFKPGVAEFAALLPAGLAQRLTAWDERRRARGAEPWSLPIKLGTHGVRGTLALRLLVSLKGWRRRGSRFAQEQALIERWLAAVEQGAREHGALGYELACCGRLIKGYGSTNERGKRNLLHIVEHLAVAPHLSDPAARAAAVRAAREAALADEAGTGLDRTLVEHGAPARPPRAQPIRWHRRRPDTPATGATRPS